MPKKSKNLCVDDLRHAEYYGMQPVFDELYRRSLDGDNFTDLMDIILSRDNILLHIGTSKQTEEATQQEQTTETSVTSGVYRPKQLWRK